MSVTHSVEFRFEVGAIVEARDVASVGQWRRARITGRAAYRGREGYDILWDDLPTPAPSWMSRGGWQQGACVRAVQP